MIEDREGETEASSVGAPLIRRSFDATDDAVKKLVIATPVLLAAIGLGAWVVLSFRAKQKYDKSRSALASVSPYVVVPVRQEDETFLSQVAKGWLCRADEVNGPHSDLVRLAGLDPSVPNLIRVSNFMLPQYSWVSTSRNRRSLQMGMARAELQMISVDGSIHVSEDQDLAFVRCTPNMVYVFRDEATGLRETLYIRKKEGIGPSDGSAAATPGEGEGRETE